MKFTNNKKCFAISGAVLCMLFVTGCASQSAEVESLQSQLRASERAVEDCQARSQTAEERIQRADARAAELSERAEELERRMARMEARMSSKG